MRLCVRSPLSQCRASDEVLISQGIRGKALPNGPQRARPPPVSRSASAHNLLLVSCAANFSTPTFLLSFLPLFRQEQISASEHFWLTVSQVQSGVYINILPACLERAANISKRTCISLQRQPGANFSKPTFFFWLAFISPHRVANFPKPMFIIRLVFTSPHRVVNFSKQTCPRREAKLPKRTVLASFQHSL